MSLLLLSSHVLETTLLICESGSVAVAGTDASLIYGNSLAADPGSVAIVGSNATFIGELLQYTLDAESGSMVVTGIAAALTTRGSIFTPVPPPEVDESAYVGVA